MGPGIGHGQTENSGYCKAVYCLLGCSCLACQGKHPVQSGTTLTISAWLLQVPQSVVVEVAEQAWRKKYETFQLRSFVEDNKRFIWCPLPGEGATSPEGGMWVAELGRQLPFVCCCTC